MEKTLYNNYPWGMVIIVNVLMLLVYVAGAYILFLLSWITGVLYLAYLVFLELNLYREGCVYCCYYGKRCAFGKGAIASVFFKKGDPKKFGEREMSWKGMVPQLLVVLVPVVVGIVLLVTAGWNIWILIAVIYSVLSWFVINPIVYGKIACPHCKQGSICCPAMKFFAKKGK